MVNADRNGELVDRSLLKSVVELFLVMGIAMSRNDFKNKEDVENSARVRGHSQGLRRFEPSFAHCVRWLQDKATGSNDTYVHDFEDPFLENSRTVYRAKCAEWFADDPVPVYLAKVEDALVREQARVDAYLNPATWPKLRRALVDEMLVTQMDTILRKEGSGLAAMLRDDKEEDLARMYRVFQLPEGGVERMAIVFREHVRDAGLALVEGRRAALTTEAGKKNRFHDPEFIESLLALQLRFRRVVEGPFSSDVVFRKELQTALNIVCNTNAEGESDQHPNAEILAHFVDMVMRGTRKDARVAEKELGEAIGVRGDCRPVPMLDRSQFGPRLAGDARLVPTAQRQGSVPRFASNIAGAPIALGGVLLQRCRA